MQTNTEALNNHAIAQLKNHFPTLEIAKLNLTNSHWIMLGWGVSLYIEVLPDFVSDYRPHDVAVMR